ncbi:MAG: filamentous hemagglutinin N-terminal domain-containing protein [Cyanobacteria bacterium J06598_3]
MLLFLVGWTPKVLAQQAGPSPLPDNTLGAEASRIQAPGGNSSLPSIGNPSNANRTNANRTIIDGGARRGAALFHSFEQFNIGENQQVFFANPLEIEAIISRITGTQPSNINGVLGVLGPADLFLLNPNGILFGPNAQLSLAGSFTASTADGLDLGEITFSATNPEALPLLTLNVQPGLQPGLLAERQTRPLLADNNPLERLIQNQATLTLAPQQQLTFDGGTVTQAGQIVVPGGTVTLRGQVINLSGRVVTQVVTQVPGTPIPSSPAGALQLVSPADLVVESTAPLSNQAIAAALQTNAVTLNAAGDLTVIGPLVSLSGTSLTLTAGNTLSLLADANAPSTLTANSPLALLPIDDSPSQIAGNVTLQSGGDLRLENSLIAGGGQADPQLQIQAGGDVLLQENPFATSAARTLLQLTGNGGLLSIQANSLDTTNTLVLTAANGGRLGPDLAIEVTQDLTLRSSALGTRATNGQTTGNITLQSGQSVQLLDLSSISATFSPNAQANTGNINIQAAADIRLESGLLLTTATGNAGDISLYGRNIILDGALGQSLIASGTTEGSAGDAGNITLNATESVELIGFVPGPFVLEIPQAISPENVIAQSFGNTTVQASAFGPGTSGDIEVNANRLVLRDGAFLANTPGFGENSGESGNIEINANDILLRGLAAIATGTLGAADAGTLDIRSDRIRLEDGAGIGVSSATGTGNAGTLNIDTQDLTVASGSNIAANTLGGGGSGGTLNIRAQNITIEGTSEGTSDRTSADVPQPSTLLTDVAPTSTGTGGKLQIQTNTLQVLNGGQIRASTQGPGDAGNLDITAEQVTVAGTSGRGAPSTLEAQSTNAGDAGTLRLVADQLTVSDGATISTRSEQGNGGNIRLVLGDLILLRRQGQISATAGELGTSGDGGNIDISTGFIVAPAAENSDITANAFAGTGGNITIDTNGLVGIAFRNALTPLSDVTASSEFGLAGTVTVEGIAEEITPETIELPAALADPAPRLVVGCLLDEDANFVVTGRGGIPANPREILNQGLIWQDPRREPSPTEPSPTELNSTETNLTETNLTETNSRGTDTARRNTSATPPSIVEAQQWQVNEQGEVELLSALNQPLASATPRCQQAPANAGIGR